jgi:hypothetical protein
MRTYEIAKATGLMSKDVMREARALGVIIRTPSDDVDPVLSQTLIETIRTSLA